MDPTDPAYPGQAEYTPWFLRICDWFVLGFMARMVWRCPTPPVVDRYRRLVGRNHLEIGPGTGYLLARANLPAGTRITLVDPNPNVLAHSSRRLHEHMVATIEGDVLKPLTVEGPFDTAAMNYVLHCLPGPMENKEAAIANVAAHLGDNGVLFGGTALGLSGRHSPQARLFLRSLNRKGTFGNLTDTAEQLREMLERWFQMVEIDVVGSMAHFVATGPLRR